MSMVSNRLKSSLEARIHGSSRCEAGVPESSDTLRLRARVRGCVGACAAACVPWDGRENPGRGIWTGDWTTNETRQIVARAEAANMGSFGFGAGWLLSDWVFRTQGFGTHDVSSGLDATRSGTGLDGQADG